MADNSPTCAKARIVFDMEGHLECDKMVAESKKSQDKVDPDRVQWNRKIEYMLTAIGYAVGLGNIWRFPAMCFKYGGGSFLVAYLTMVIFCGLPIYVLEAALGQFASNGPTEAFCGVALFRGIGFASLICSVLVGSYYNVVMAWDLKYLFHTIGSLLRMSPVPWDTQEYSGHAQREHNYTQGFKTDLCADKNPIGTDGYLQYVIQGRDKIYVESQTGCGARNATTDTKATFDVFQLGGVEPQLFLALAISWVFIGIVCVKGIRTSGRFMYVLTTLPYVILTILLVKGLTLWDQGAKEGIMAFLTPKREQLLTIGCWQDAATQIFFSLSIALGGVVTMSSYSKFTNNFYKDSYIVVAANSMTSIVAGFTVFAYMGYYAEQKKMELKNVNSGGPSLTFIVWPEAMTLLSKSPTLNTLFAAIFFLMLYFMGISSMVALVETCITCITDTIPSLRKRRTKVTLAVIGAQFIMGLPMVTRNGIYWFQVWDSYCITYTLVICALFEVVVISYIYKLDRFSEDVKMMTGRYLPRFYQIMYRIVTPSIMSAFLLYLIYSLFSQTNLAAIELYENKYPIENAWPIVMAIAGAPLLTIVYIAFTQLKQNDWNLRRACNPMEGYGPCLNESRFPYDRYKARFNATDSQVFKPPSSETSASV